MFKQNDTVKVKLIEIVTEDKKIHLGIKQLSDDPWEKINNFINEKDHLNGKVLFTMDKGIVVLLDNDFEGIIPASKLNDNIDNYKVNDKLSLNVEEVNTENRRIALSILDDNSESNADKSKNDDNAVEDTENNETDNTTASKEE